MHHFQIYFADDTSKRVLVKKTCKNGFKTRIVDFKGGLKEVVKVEVWYQPDPLKSQKSRIYLWCRGE